MSIENELKELIIRKSKSIRQFSNEVDIPATTIQSMLNSGIENAGVKKVTKICDFLGLDIDALADGYIKEKTTADISMTVSELKHIEKYRTLNEYDKESIDVLLDRLYLREEPRSYINLEAPKLIECYPRLASAGTGQYLFDDIPAEKIEVEWNSEADFAIGVQGDSMEPTYKDEDTLLVKRQDNIEIGDIGIFIVNGESFVKEYQKNRLVSHNDEYEDIKFNENMNIVCVGKVIGAID